MNDYVNRNRSGYDKEQESIASSTVTTAATGAGIKVGENMEVRVKFSHNGVLGNADNTLGANVEESDDNVTFSVLQAMGGLTAAIEESTTLVRTTKAYIRVKTGAAAGTTASVGGVQAYLES